MRYTFKCVKCTGIIEKTLKITEDKIAICCGEDAKRVYSFNSVVAPQHQAAGSKLEYYGISNPITGEGITDNTILREDPGINL